MNEKQSETDLELSSNWKSSTQSITLAKAHMSAIYRITRFLAPLEMTINGSLSDTEFTENIIQLILGGDLAEIVQTMAHIKWKKILESNLKYVRNDIYSHLDERAR